MRKLIVKILNLLYIAAAGIAIYALCTRPMFKATVKAHFTKEQMGLILSKAFNHGESEESEEDRVVYRVSTSNMNDYITKEKVEGYFPNGYDLTIPVEIPVTSAFNFQNTKLLDDLIQSNLYKVIDNIVVSLDKPLHSLFRDIVKGFALDTLESEINKQIAEMFPDGEAVTQEELNQVFDDVYSLLDGDEPVSVDDLASTILHGKDDGEGGTTGGVLDIINSRGGKYVPYDPQPSESEVEADRTAEGDAIKYYVEEITYSHNTNSYKESVTYYEKTSGDVYVAFDPQPSAEEVEADREAEEASWTYFVQNKNYSHNTAAYDSSVTYFEKKPYTNEDIDEDKITQEMVKSLEDVDGLVTKVPVLCDPQPTQEQVEADIAIENEKNRVYYILDGNGEPVLPTEYSSEATYYTVNKVVNDIDTAMETLIAGFLDGNSGSGDNRAVVRAEEQLQSAESEDSLNEAIRAYLENIIPTNISERTGQIGEKAPYILLGVVALFALPWAWFAIVTLIRTLRKQKCWTRLGIVIWGALLQVILGVGLTYGAKYAWPAIASRIDTLKEYANAINFDIRTGCLIPSFIWLGIAISAIPYWIIRRPLKTRYKLMKYNKKVEMKKAAFARERERFINSPER